MKHVRFEMRISREVDGREGNVPHQTRRCPSVQSHDTKLPDDMNCAFFQLFRRGFRGFALHLQPNLHDLKWVREHDLTTTSRSTSDELPPELDPTSLWICCKTADKIVDGKLYGLLGGNTLHIELISTSHLVSTEGAGNSGKFKLTISCGPRPR